MENDKIICGECGTENEKKYVYCKNCGVKLQSGENTQPAGTQYSSQFGASPEGTPNGNRTTFIDSNPNYVHEEQHNSDNIHVNSNFVHHEQNDPNDNFAGHRAQENTSDSSAGFQQNASSRQNYSNFNEGNTNPNFNGTKPENSFYVDTIGGIPYGEVAVYVGRKAPIICPKFAKMEITGSKISWCWPAAVLGFLLGPLGAAIWFFYRKMYKIALILVAIGVACTIATTVLTYDSDLKNAASQSLEDILGSGDEITTQNFSTFSFFKYLTGHLSTRDRIASLLDDIASLTTCIVTGLFAFVWYKKQAIDSIIHFRQSNVDPKYYQMGLMSIGGTSGGMVALGIILLLITKNIAEFIVYLV